MINVDNNSGNADWIKSKRLDIPFVRTWNDVQNLILLPKRGAERLAALQNLGKTYAWVQSLPTSIKDAIANEIKRLERNLKRDGGKDA